MSDDNNTERGSLFEGFRSAPAPMREPEPPALDVLAVALAEMYLTAPRTNPQGFGMQPPPSPTECLARAKRFAADLVPLIIHTDRDEIELALRLNAAHGIGAGLALNIAREWVALRNSITPPE